MTDNEANKLFGEEVLNSAPVLETMYADIFVEGWLGGYSFLAIVDDSPFPAYTKAIDGRQTSKLYQSLTSQGEVYGKITIK